MTLSFVLLAVLGVLIILVGVIVVIVAAFRVSLAWGFAVLLFFPLASLVFLLLHWGKAKDGFAILLVGAGLPFAAAYLLIPSEDREKLVGTIKEYVGSVTSPDPFAAAPGTSGDSGGVKKPAPAIPQTQVLDFSSVGGAQAPADVGIRTPSTVVAPTAGLLENETQVTAAMAELTQRSRQLTKRKEQMANSKDEAELRVLKSEIEAYNKRLTEVRAAEQRVIAAKLEVVADQRFAAVPKNKLSGTLQGRQVVFDHAVLDRKRAMLTLRQGDEKAPDATLTIMFGARVDEPFNKKRVVRDPAGANSPPVTVTLKRGAGQPVSKPYNKGYGLYVEFSEDVPEGRIYLSLPDESKSVIQGTFRLSGAADDKK